MLFVHSKFWRPFPLTFLYCILSIIVILCTKQACSSVGGQALEKCFGAWVRIPGPPNYFICFFFQWSHACTGGMTTMVHHDPASQVSRWPDLRAIRWRSTKGLGQSKAWDSKGQRGPLFLGPKKCYPHPRNYLQSRPNLFIFSFILFYLIYLFIFTNTN